MFLESKTEIESLRSLFLKPPFLTTSLKPPKKYWTHPRNELNSVSFYYSPATWYLTLSSGECTWEDSGKYLHKINPKLADNSISELVIADPIATSHFIDNKLKAFLEL